ncbi:MAG: hypothetical protein JO034_08405 [Singulisphaera sp.]|nr:hypothetical protein [Singulisphaera sp.]
MAFFDLREPVSARTHGAGLLLALPDTFFLWHRSSGCHPAKRLRGRLDLDADPIIRIVHPAPTRRVGFTQPPRADDGQEDIAPGDRVLQEQAKIPTTCNLIEIIEYIISPKLTLEPLVDVIGNVLAVLAPVGDEHIHCGVLPLGSDYRYWTGERIHPSGGSGRRR